MGAIGVDLNTDHLAVSEIDRFGNFVRSYKIPCVTYGKPTNQRKAIIGDAVKEVVEIANSQVQTRCHRRNSNFSNVKPK